MRTTRAIAATLLLALPPIAAAQPCSAPSSDGRATPLLGAPDVVHVGVPQRPNPTVEQVEGLRVLETEGEEFLARGRQFRADVERLASSREEAADRQRRTLMVPGPLSPTPAVMPPGPAASTEPAPRDAVARLAAALDGAEPGTARYVDALEALAATLARPDPRLDARCRPLAVALAGTPASRRAPLACAALLRVVSSSELASEPLPAAVLSPPWTAALDARRAWRPALILQLAADALHGRRTEEGVALLRAFRRVYPLDADAPAAADRIVAALTALGRTEQADAAAASFVDFVEGTPWQCAHRHDPALLARTAPLLARHLRHAAEAAHRRAEEARHAPPRGRSAGGAADEARRADDLAASLLAACLDADPDAEDADDLRMRRAVALAGAGRHDEAADAFAALLGAGRDDAFSAAAARGMLDQRRAHVLGLVARAELDACDAVRGGIDPAVLVGVDGRQRLNEASARECEAIPTGDGRGAVREIAIPGPIRVLMDARVAVNVTMSRERAVSERATAADDVPSGVRPGAVPLQAWLAHQNARAWLRFGRVDEAERLLRAVQQHWPCGAVADEGYRARGALFALQQRSDDAEALERERLSRRCVGSGEPCATDPVSSYAVDEMMINSQFRRATARFREAERAPPQEARALYERAAEDMDWAVRDRPNHPRAALAHFYVALALERSGRFLSAAERYSRITREFNTTRSAEGRELCGEELGQRLNILEVSYFRAAVNAERNYDFDAAVQFHRALIDDSRFATSWDREEHLHDALASIALIETNLARWPEAAAAWAAFLPVAEPGRERAEALFRLAEIPFHAGRWRDATRSLEAYARSPTTADDAPFHVEAWSLAAEAARRLHAGARSAAARHETVRAFRAAGLTAWSRAAALAVAASLPEVEARAEALMTPRAVGGGAGIAALARDVEELARLSGAAAIAARVRLGEVYEHLAGAGVAEGGQREGPSDWRALAIEQYALAVCAAREVGMPSQHAERALDRLHAEENRERLDAVLRHQGRVPYRAGMFDEHPPGALVLEGSLVATPPLVGP